MTKLYQLCAKGPRATFESFGKISSKRVFLTREAAEAYVPEFTAACLDETGGRAITALRRVDSVAIGELELDDEETRS